MSGPDTPDTAVASAESEKSGLPVTRIVVGVLAVVALVAFGRTLGGPLQEFARWVDGLGFFAPLVFAVAYAAAVVAFAPASVLTIAAGAIFGIAKGTIYTLAGATLGATAAFLIARYVAREKVEKMIAGNEKFAAIDRAVGQDGRKIVFLLRLTPVFPFSMGNYALGLTRVRFVDYVVACAGMLPGTLLYVYSGYVAGQVASLAGGVGAERGVGFYAWLLLVLVATVAVTALVTRTARRALASVTGEEADTASADAERSRA